MSANIPKPSPSPASSTVKLESVSPTEAANSSNALPEATALAMPASTTVPSDMVSLPFAPPIPSKPQQSETYGTLKKRRLIDIFAAYIIMMLFLMVGGYWLIQPSSTRISVELTAKKLSFTYIGATQINFIKPSGSLRGLSFDHFQEAEFSGDISWQTIAPDAYDVSKKTYSGSWYPLPSAEEGVTLSGKPDSEYSHITFDGITPTAASLSLDPVLISPNDNVTVTITGKDRVELHTIVRGQNERCRILLHSSAVVSTVECGTKGIRGLTVLPTSRSYQLRVPKTSLEPSAVHLAGKPPNPTTGSPALIGIHLLLSDDQFQDLFYEQAIPVSHLEFEDLDGKIKNNATRITTIVSATITYPNTKIPDRQIKSPDFLSLQGLRDFKIKSIRLQSSKDNGGKEFALTLEGKADEMRAVAGANATDLRTSNLEWLEYTPHGIAIGLVAAFLTIPAALMGILVGIPVILTMFKDKKA